MKTYMFPGQGSQSKGMGVDLFDQFKDLTTKADKILGYSIKNLCLNDPKKELNQTQFTQPALFVVNALSYYKKIEESGEIPDYVAGHSLGELNALLAAECFDFEVGLQLVQKRGELMRQATKGGMAAVLNSSEEHILDLLEKGGLKNISVANYNTATQIVISGLRDEIDQAEKLFSENKVRIIVLNTSGAFHSKYMEPAKQEFEAFLKEFEYSELKIPVISNRTAAPYEEDKVVETLSGQIISPVRWVDSIRHLMAQGAMEFVEIGHGDVLTKLLKKIEAETPQETKERVESVEAVGTVPQETEPDVQAVNEVLPGGTPSELSPTDLTEEDNAKDATAEEKVDAWNKNYAIGTKVKSLLMDDETLETRTEAVVLFGIRAAVYMDGYNGYFDLDEIIPLGD